MTSEEILYFSMDSDQNPHCLKMLGPDSDPHTINYVSETLPVGCKKVSTENSCMTCLENELKYLFS